jgi:predicted alpha/beta-hydrolase family hydrolase
MLFLQGTRDTLAELTLLTPVVERLGSRATLRQVEHADHMFHVLKRSGRTNEQVLDGLALEIAEWQERRA